MSNRSFYTAMLGIMFCSVAFALQPTVRAGSISLNSGVKPATNTVTKTASTSSGGASVSGTVNSTARGSALSKFGTAVVPINKNNTANNEYQQALEDLRTAIADLDNQQADLRQRQLTRNDVTEVIANTDLRGTNSGLNDTLTAMDTANTTLQESVQTIQQQTEQFTDALDETMDAKLRQRDLIDANNNAKVTTNTIRELQDSLAPTALATSIAQSDAAKATLNDAGFAKKTDLNSAIENIAGDLNNFVTNDALNTQLTRENLASKLGDEYVKDTDLTQATLSAKLGNAYLTNDTLTKATITDKLGDEYVKDTDFAGKLASSGVATNESVTELASNVQGLSTNVQTLSGNLDALSGNVGTLSGNVQTLTTKVNGDVNTQGSLLYDIRNNADIRTALKGDQGPAGPAGAAGVQGEKGDKGDAGTSFAFRSAITNNSEREECTAATQGYAYYNSTNGNMYICGCINNTCQYAEAHIRGEDGAAGEPGTRGPAGQDAKTPEQVYCETNFDIVSALYSAVQTTSDCADSSKFSNENYTAILGGATAYCLSILQTSSNLNLETGIGKKLVDTFGQAKMQQLKTTSTLQGKLDLGGFKVDNQQEADFMTACKARYNEIMYPKSAEQTYCEAQAENYPTGTTNLTLIRRLFNDNNITCDTFSAEQYAAITGGAKAFCSSLSTNFNQVDLDKDVGLKMAKVYAAKKNVSLDTAKTALAAKKTLSVEQRLLDTDFSIVLECINNYNNIMSGEDGADGRDAETAWHAYCAEGNNLSNIITPLYSSVTNCDQFTSEQYNAIMGGAKAYCLSLAQNASNLSPTTGIGKKLTLTLGDDAVSRLQQNGLNATFTVNNESKKFVEACEIKYNEIMAGEKGDNGDTFVPSFNTTTGKITWTKDNNTTSVNDFDIGSTIDTRANAVVASKIDTKVADDLVTLDDLVNYINAGLFSVDTSTSTPKVVVGTTLQLHEDSNTSDAVSSLQKLIGRGFHQEVSGAQNCATSGQGICTTLQPKKLPVLLEP